MRRLPTKRSTKMVLIALVAFATMIPVVANAAAGFVDVEDSNVFVADIQWMADNGITQGCNPPANDMFCPGNNVTREQMSAFMHRLATSQAVDAGTLDGLTAADFIEHGTIVTTQGGTAWQPHSVAPTTFARNVIDTTVSGNGMAVMALNAPTTIGGVEYGLESIEMCLTKYGAGAAFVTRVTASRQNADGSNDAILNDATDVSATGCYLYSVDAAAGMGIGFLVETAGSASDTIRLGSVKATWTTTAGS